ncbi:protein Smaug [Bradysia coprophila]|uniref:protein Smaug n=1 Tax=Bradysia coprophila TaxID=38358 RepID=UPI00187DBAC4|nr:protein Smaug [Bradysia coprophila]
MKFESKLNATAPTIFSEQLSNVIDLFQQWNDCERAVMLFAVLKRVPFPLTKLLQSVIETSLQQAQCKEQAKILERNANCAKYINSLSETYKSLKYNETQLTTESIFFASDRSIDNIDKCCDKKEEILRDILKMMPILTIGNDEAKSAYLDFIPMTVSDATRRIVSSTLVQQIFCYVLIHPAFSIDDRSSVVKHLKVLENHISTNEPNIFVYRNGASPTSEPTNPSTPSNWQAIAPPQSKSTDTIPPPSPWGSSHHLTRGYTDDSDYRSHKSASISSSVNNYEIEDRHTSFLYNGKIVNDVDDTNTSNTQLGFVTLPGLTKHLISPGTLEHVKTRRSNSLTTTSPVTRTSFTQNACEKQRSVSLSGISTLNFGGSDISMLDESKPIFQWPQRHHVGMSNITPWLKSLRLHKYVFLFSHQTYEQMMEMTEDHLMNVTKGARQKLVNNIQKLRERYAALSQMEKDLLCGQITVAKVLEELSALVITPMKPIEPFDKQDVPTQFLKVVDLVYTKITTKHIVPQDENYVNQLMYILDKAMHNEAFVAQINLLKERRHNMQRIKSQFPPKIHYSKSNEASASTSSNIHRQRLRPIKFNDYFTPFPKTNRFAGNLNPGLSFSDVTQFDSFYAGAGQNQPPQRTDDRFIFKIPAVPAPTNHRSQTISGSIESISSGYHSDSTPIGMGNIRKWLKSHRLHKYTWVFENVNYEKIFTFTEEHLKSLSITQGAAHKLANCIEKLNTRAETLKQTGLNLTLNRMFVPEAVLVMDSIVLSPMKPMRLNCDTDVGYQLWNVINQVFKLLASNSYDEDTVLKFTRVVDSAMGSEAFVDYIHIIRDMRMKVARLGRRMIR